MDVSPFRALTVSVAVVLLSACANEGPSNAVYNPSKVECSENVVKGEFIVKWQDGRITRRKSDLSGYAFAEEMVAEHGDKIIRIEEQERIYLPAPTYKLHRFNEQIDNWGAAATHAEEAWTQDIRGEGIVVAVIDSGVDYTHPQLVNQIAYNKGEYGTDEQGNDKSFNGIDDDKNGYVDDYIGYDFAHSTAIMSDTNSHGTHVAGIIAAEHFDSEAAETSYVQGVAPLARILPLAFIDESGGGNLSDAIEAIDYAAKMGARVINASWGGAPCSELLGERIKELEAEGILFITASGNSGIDIDRFPQYPAAYNHPSQITVGSIGRFGSMADHSNYGDVAVHIFAPGVEIFSTIPGDQMAAYSGTSMATPFVAGAAALLWSHRPELSAKAIRDALLSGVSQSDRYRNATRGRLHIGLALEALESNL